MVIQGEKIIGLTAELAMDKIFEIELECGYFVKSNDPRYNRITVTVTGEASSELQNQIDKLEREICISLEAIGVDVYSKIEMVKNDAHDKLVNKLLNLDKTLDKESVNSLTDDKIIALIGAYYVETYEFPTQELEELYNNFKKSEIKFANVKAINELEGGLKTLSATLQKTYIEFQTSIQSALDSFDTLYNKYFVDSKSDFQKSYKKVKNLKAEVLKMRAEIAKMEDGVDKNSKELTLTAKEAALTLAENALNSAKEAAKVVLDEAKVTIKSIFDKIDELIAKTPELQTIYEVNKVAVEDYLNNTKDKIFENFENKYKTQIENIAKQVSIDKTNIINSIKEFVR